MSQSNPLSPLLPVRYQPSFFSIDIASLPIKDTQQTMEHPLFTLSKHPDVEDRHYSDSRGNTLTVRPISLGLPTIWDKDLLIFAISQIVERRNRGEKVSPTVRFHTADVIEFANMTGGGATYRRLDRALHRLAGCTITTNIKTGGEITTNVFHIIDKATIKRQYDQPGGRLQYCEFTLSDWLWRAVEANEVLTLNPNYFRLRQALARRIYEIARKHCGRQAQWEIELSLLHHKTGARMSLRHFRVQVKRLSTHGDLLDYDMELVPRYRELFVRFRRREGSLVDTLNGPNNIVLEPNVASVAQGIIGTAGDVKEAEKDWRRWMRQKGLRPTNAEAFFLSFCRRWAQTRGLPESGVSPDSRPSFRDKLAETWWAGLDDNARQRWLDGIGLRAELADGTGWWHSEESLAKMAFDRLYPFQGVDPADAEFPPVLLERLSEELEGNAVTSETLTAAWRAHAGTYSVLPNINDPLLSLWLFAQDVKKGKPAAMQAVQATDETAEDFHQQKSEEEQREISRETTDTFDAWCRRAMTRWHAMLPEQQEAAKAKHSPPLDLIEEIENTTDGEPLFMDINYIVALRAYAVIAPPPEDLPADSYEAYQEDYRRNIIFTDEGFAEYHGFYLDPPLAATWEERVLDWWEGEIASKDRNRLLTAHRNDPPVRAAREARICKEKVEEIVAFRAYREAKPDDLPTDPDHPHLAVC